VTGKEIKISLILCTVNRKTEVIEFIESLIMQNYTNFELIIVDQNLDNRILKIVQQHNKLINIVHVNSIIGLSKARNIGLRHASGSVVGFPDDDCTYSENLLDNVASYFFNNAGVDFLLGKTIDPVTNLISAGKIINNHGPIYCSKFGGSSTSLFINTKLEKIDYFLFDENFGIGAKFHAEEENDLIIRMLNSGKKGTYAPNELVVFHPSKDSNYSDIGRAKERGFGFGALTAKHIFTKCGLIYFVNYFMIRMPISIAIAIMQFNWKKSKYIFHKYLGAYKGFYNFFSNK
jgi:glycosyltransferase involved in cell wall biosynthesis